VKISVTNLGPIKEADIDLAPLTIFIGPNTSGKSVLATVVYATLYQAGADRQQSIERQLRRLRRDDETAAEVNAFLPIVAEQRVAYDEIPASVKILLVELLKNTIEDFVTYNPYEIQRATGTAPGAIVRGSQQTYSTAEVRLASRKPSWRATSIMLPNHNMVTVEEPPSLREAWDALPAPARREQPTTAADVLRTLLFYCFREAPTRTYYLPAARSGILHSQKAIAGALIRQASLSMSGADDRKPSMTGVVADFLGEMTELDPTDVGDFPAEAERLEQDVLHGSIRLVGESSPEVIFRDRGGDYPLMNTSSMVSELAPVILYLRHRLRHGNLLLIEEPEAHLHPGTQVAFAQGIVRLVNQGLRVGLTTHSEFFLQQLNNAIMAGTLPEDQAAELGISGEDSLDAEKVAAYFFQPTDEGTTVTSLPIDPKDGIPEASFDTVTEQLYNQTIRLDRSLGAQDDE
jgi:predicted ATPase